jgi:hypothetical protein
MKIIFLIVGILVLAGCSSALVKSVDQSEYDNYFISQKIEKELLLGSYEREGRKYSNSEEPLKSDQAYCLNLAFNGVKLTFGTRPVSDPFSFLQFDADNKMEILDAMLTKKPIKSKFKGPDFSKNLKTIVQKNKQRKACLENKGWSFKV